MQPSNGERNLCYVREGIHTSSLPVLLGAFAFGPVRCRHGLLLVSACVSRIHGQAAI